MAEFKFPCPQCRQHIQCDTGYAGMQIDCPICKRVILVPQPPRAADAPVVLAKSQTMRNVIVITAAVVVLAGLITAGWFGWSKIGIFIKRGHLPSGVVMFWPGGIHFDGKENHISVPNTPELNFGAGRDFSIEGWIKPLRPPPHPREDIMSFVDKREEPNNMQCQGYEFCLVHGKIHLRMSDSLAGIGQDWMSPGPDLRDGRFHHVAVTVIRNSTDGGKMFVDGEVVLTFDPTGVAGDLSNDQPLLIGNHPDPAYQCFFHGEIKNVAVFNRALSASEIQAIYTKQK